MNQIDKCFEDLANSNVDKLLHDDSYYQGLATPLRSSEAIKAQERKNLVELLQFKTARLQMQAAEELIRTMLASHISQREWNAVISELDRAPLHFLEEMEKLAEDSDVMILPQNLFGISNESLIHFYNLAIELFNKKEFEKAIAILVFLEVLTPNISSFWLAHGICLQSMQHYSEGIKLFEAAKQLDANDPSPSFHTIECHLALHEKDKARVEHDRLKQIIDHLDNEKKSEWSEKAKKLVII